MGKQRNAHKGANKHVIKQKRVSQKDKCGSRLRSIVILYWSMDETHVPSDKVPKRDLGSRVQKMGVNPHKKVSKNQA